MRKVIGIGETVYDIVFKGGQPTAAVPGGSTFNSMISIGRCGIPADFLSEVGDDHVGSIIREFMSQNGVDPGFVNILPGKTPLSLAFLDEKNDATYTFYRDPVSERPDFIYPSIEPGDIVLFGSFYALNPACRPQVERFLEYAKSSGAILYYDVNFRPSHVKDLGNIGNALWENLSLADVVRGSHEDFRTLFGMEDAAEVYQEKIKPRCGNFICTYGLNLLSYLLPMVSGVSILSLRSRRSAPSVPGTASTPVLSMGLSRETLPARRFRVGSLPLNGIPLSVSPNDSPPPAASPHSTTSLRISQPIFGFKPVPRQDT